MHLKAPNRTLGAALVAASVAVGAPALAADTATPTKESAMKEMRSDLNIVETTAHMPRFDTLLDAIQEAGLSQKLQYQGPYTMFAPTDAAFGNLPDSRLDDLVRPENEDRLNKVVGCHVVEGEIDADDLRDRIDENGGPVTLTSMGGCDLTVAEINGALTVSDAQGNTAQLAPETEGDQINGYFHVIDKVMQPAS